MHITLRGLAHIALTFGLGMLVGMQLDRMNLGGVVAVIAGVMVFFGAGTLSLCMMNDRQPVKPKPER